MLDLFLSLTSGLWGYIATGVGVIVALFAARQSGKKSERNKQKVRDHERADEIRNRVRDAPDDSVRKHDDAGYRD